MTLLGEMYEAVQAFRAQHYGVTLSRIRVTPETFDTLARMCVPVSADVGLLGYSAGLGVPLVVDEDLPVRWRLEYDGPPA